MKTTYNFCGNSRSRKLQHFAVVILSQILEHLNFSILFPWKLKPFPQSVFHSLDQFISTFSDRNHSVKLQELKLSTENFVTNYIAKCSRPTGGIARPPILNYTRVMAIENVNHIWYTRRASTAHKNRNLVIFLSGDGLVDVNFGMNA